MESRSFVQIITKRHQSGFLLRFGEFVLLSLFTSSVLLAQMLQVSPPQVLIRMAATGPLAVPQTLSIKSGTTPSLSWKATVSDDAPWISLSAVAGTAPAQISLSLLAWRGVGQPPGT